MKVEYGKTGTYFYWIGLILIGVFIPTSKFGLSVTQFYLIALWLLLGLDMRAVNKMFPEKPFVSRILSRIVVSFKGIWNNIKTRFDDFIHNKVAVVMVSMYLMHFIGLIYTSDFHYAFKDLRIKLPLLVFPLILSSMKPLNKKQFDTVIWFFVSSVFFVTVLGAIKFFRRDFVDVRELSVFVSHIRVSLCMVFSIFVLAYYFIKRNYSVIVKAIIVLLIIWFLWQITIWESFISVLIIAALCAVLALYFIFKSRNVLVKISTVVVMIAGASVMFYAPYKIIYEYNNPEELVVEQLDTHTKLGNPYVFEYNMGIEDGRYIGLYLSKEELLEAWNQRSEKKIGHEYQDGYYCLVRYMTSKDLRKDAEGVYMLTEEDIRNIENGVANYNYIENPGIKTRIMRIMVAYNNYKRNGDANGSSVFQRVEFIKASFGIIKENPVFGVGTGDIVNAFAQYYEDTNSKLRPEYRFRSHNQYLAITVAFGVVGLMWYLFSMFYPFFAEKKNRNYIYFVFLFIMMLSMLTEDTIETQIGVTLFAFFNSFLVFANDEDNDESLMADDR
ncbi:MAG: O-antigen ligase family protein [Bacteroidales bacterium]|nr:O-antigen ligase family protein [Bacteroidales bacterium]